jgi:hypothetical protein
VGEWSVKEGKMRSVVQKMEGWSGLVLASVKEFVGA